MIRFSEWDIITQHLAVFIAKIGLSIAHVVEGRSRYQNQNGGEDERSSDEGGILNKSMWLLGRPSRSSAPLFSVGTLPAFHPKPPRRLGLRFLPTLHHSLFSSMPVWPMPKIMVRSFLRFDVRNETITMPAVCVAVHQISFHLGGPSSLASGAREALTFLLFLTLNFCSTILCKY